MLLIAFIGGIIMYAALSSNEVSTGAAIIGLVMVIFGLLGSSIVSEQLQARGNRRRYWAYGEKPDWRRSTNTKRLPMKHIPDVEMHDDVE